MSASLTIMEDCVVMNASEDEADRAFGSTVERLHRETDALVQQSNDLYQEHMQQQYQLLQLQQTQVEIEHLRKLNEQNTKTIQNLLQAVEQSRTQAQDASHAALAEARLRAELSVMVAQRDDANSHAEQQQHTVTLLQEQIQDFKMKLSRLTQQKIQLERDCLRNAQSASKSTMTTASSAMHHSTALDSDYYPRKVQELQGRVQSLQVVVAEKNRQIEELSQQLERQWNPSKWSTTSTGRHTS